MKTDKLNILIDSFIKIVEATLQLKPTKGGVSVKYTTQTNKEYILHIPIQGEVNGFLSIGMSKSLLINITEVMTVGMGDANEVDDMAISCVLELGGMIKGELINVLTKNNSNIEVMDAQLLKRDEQEIKENTVVVVTADTKIGNFELNLSMT